MDWGLNYWQRLDVQRAVKAVARLSGKAQAGTDEAFQLASFDLSGKAMTDSNLAGLTPLLAAARGPATLNLSRTQISDWAGQGTGGA